MAYSSLRSAIEDLRNHGHLAVIDDPVDPHLEMAAIQRRVYAAGGPAVYYAAVTGSPFPAVSNLYGTHERTRFLFRQTLDAIRQVVALKADPSLLLKNPFAHFPALRAAFHALPRKIRGNAPVLYGQTTLDQLPQIVSWPRDGGAFVTLPQVFTLPPGSRQPMQGNLGMYRIQISGNQYGSNEAGMHYQIHRGIGVHHTMYQNSQQPFRVSIFIGGPPAHALSAVMPLPEGLSELTFAGMLGGRRFRYRWQDEAFLSADADFCITGTILPDRYKPEGPFGDHLGYYSLQHDFPVLQVDRVYHRKNPIWQFTVVGRPPQEDSSFGYLIHEIVGPLLPQEFPGVKAVNAVDAAGVHPLLIAIGSERYMPFRDRQPEEILTQANHLLGKGQTSLAKYLLIAADGDAPGLDVHDLPAFFAHVLERFDPLRDLHFYTNTTIDTLDYSGTGFNAGSKLVIAACGPVRRTLGTVIPEAFFPEFIHDVSMPAPGILALDAGPFIDRENTAARVKELEEALPQSVTDHFPVIVLVDDAPFIAQTFNHFLWVTFTRSNPSHDIYGLHALTAFKHWGCRGPVVIDARIKPWHAPVLETDPTAEALADRHFRRGAPLAKWG